MSAPDPSLAASDPRRSAWVSANAGAGKTYTLANRVTRLLLGGAPPEKILCLTYTKAAAAEMSKRLFAQLGEWAMLPDGDLAARIAAIGGAVGDLAKARRLFASALETPGGLKIQTIHSFCQYVLSRFPLEAGVPPGFTVLDERTARDLLALALARVLERAGAGDGPRAAAISHLVTHAGEFRMAQILDAALGADRRKLDAFLADCPDAETRARRVRQAHGAGAADTPHGVAEAFCAAIDDDALRAAAQWLAKGGKTDADRGTELAAFLEEPDTETRYEILRGALLTDEGTVRKTLATKKLAEARPDLLAFLAKLADGAVEAEERRRAAMAASLCEAALTVADAVRDIYAAEKRARGALDYDDLIVETHRLLSRRASAAWVLYKLDGGIDHVLIDEAQDTSGLQWDIVKLLTGEFFAGEGSSHADAPVRTLFAVGDEKQSIFSFQGADPEQFAIRRHEFAGLAEAAGRDFSYARLDTSRRSAPEILSFVDAVFADPAARDGLTSEDLAIAHRPLRLDARGRVEFWPSLKAPDAPQPDPWEAPVDLPPADNPVARLAARIAERIAGWIARGTALPGKDRPIAPGDIMILLPRREPFGSAVIRALKARAVPVAGADRIRLSEQIAVMDLIALGRFAILPEDDLNLAALLRSPLAGLGEDDLFRLAHGREGRLWRELERRRGEPAFAAAHEFLSDMRMRADRMPPFEFYGHALTARGGRRNLLKRLGAEAADAIDEFLSLALAHERAATPSLEGFLHWVALGAGEIRRDMERGRDEVRVMTVHGAKGLEADIVILPDTTRLPEDSSMRGHLLYTEDGVLFPAGKTDAPRAVAAAKEAARAAALREHRRLLYVALTRAKERLYIAGFENRKGVRPGSWYELTERAASALGRAVEEDGRTIRVYGEDADGAAAAAPGAPSVTVPDWARTPPKAERARPRPIHPSEMADETPLQPPFGQGGAERFRRGLLVHALLARLPEVPPQQRAGIAAKFLRANRMDDAEAAAVAASVLAVLDDPVFAPAFAQASRAEVALAADLPELGDTSVTGRIDRLAVGDEVLIVDFKTGRPPGADAVPALYLSQMALYRAAAERIFPGRRIACALVWTEGPRLMRLPEARLDRELARIRARLDPEGRRS